MAILLFVTINTASTQAANTCISFTTNLSYGMNDSSSSHEVKDLQSYLYSKGYLKSSPNGHFGSATRAAVKLLQGKNGITATGTAGPQTRALLQKYTCSNNTITSIPVSATAAVINASGQDTTVISSQPISNTIIPAVAPTVASSTPAPVETLAITSPQDGESLTIGATRVIQWVITPNYPFNLLLVRSDGSGAGYVATSLSGVNQYTWQVGRVFDSAIQDFDNVATGTYRFKITPYTYGQFSGDYVSGYITLNAPPLVINSLTPTSVLSSQQTSIVAFGSGFDSTSSIRIDTPYGIPVSRLYISPDGTTFVFNIPSGIAAGSHYLYAVNQYGTASNGIAITIN